MYIDIYNGNKPLGRFDLPKFIEGENGNVFCNRSGGLSEQNLRERKG